MTDPKPPSHRDEQQEHEKWYERTRYQILLFAGGIALFGLVLGLMLDWYIDPQTSTQKKDLIQALGLITAGVAGAIGIYFTWRGQRHTREAQEENQQSTQAQLRHAQEELWLNRQGQITERFTRAIDQLGHDRTEIRLGGIYALERIARESEEDHWPIMEVLTAYVRQHARWLPAQEHEGSENAAVEKESTEDSRGKFEIIRVPPLDPDIEAIMTVLRRRTRFFGNGEDEPIDLRETDLSGVSLTKVNLVNATLWGTNLSGAFLRYANLKEAYLAEADLKEADLKEANLAEAYLWKANLSGANLSKADLKEANLSEANLAGANLLRANLTRADLAEANLAGANLLWTMGLTHGQLHQAVGDETTQLPIHLTHPYFWPEKLTDPADEH